MRKTICIDGRQLLGQIGGVQRYIYEIVNELDKIVKPEEFEILIPQNGNLNIEYKNLRVKRIGKLKGLLWEQISLPIYLFLHRRKCIYPCSVISMLYPKGIYIVHDVMPKKIPEVANSFGLFARIMLLINYRIGIRKADKVVTVSECSKNDICELYKIDDNKVSVIGNAWQHFKRIIPDKSWDKKFPELKSGEFYFSLSANRKQKNFKWICEVAKKNPNEIFAIAGTKEEWQKKMEINAPNIIHLGFISDEEIKALMMNCKAFIFPSTYEGFGIPPMEALSTGAQIIIANSSCLPEIYGDSAHYIDPYDYNVDLDCILSTKVENPQKTLDRYGWDLSARKLYELCKEIYT